MKLKALFKDTITEIKVTFNRFLSIFAIIALGTGFFAGIKATCPDMLDSAQKYFSEYNLMDSQLKSSMGFTEDDIQAVNNLDFVFKAQSGYTVDVFVSTEDETSIVRIYSLNIDSYATDANYINKLFLKEGRLPKKDNECVIDNGIMANGKYSIGDTIKVSVDDGSELSDCLNYDTFKIVGFVDSIQYISFERGKSNIGSGTISSYMFVPDGAFSYEVYTDIYLRFTDTQQLNFNTDEYKNIVERHLNELETFAETREEIRYNEITKEANEEILEAETEFKENETSAYEQINSAQAILDENCHKLEQKREEALAAFEEAEIKINNAQTQIDESLKNINASYSEIESKLSYFKFNEDTQVAFNALRTTVSSYPNAKEEAEDIIKSIFDQTISQDKYSDIINSANLLILNLSQNELTDLQTQSQIIRAAVSMGILDGTKAQLNLAQNELNAQKSDLETQKTNTFEQLDDAANQIEAGQNELQSQIIKIENELNDARTKISEAKDEISKIEKPVWYVFDRTYNPGYESFAEDAERVDKISAVFPVFFILVAMLVCLTTMTRMVEEQRTQIGTLKALGYSKWQIMFKYLFYAGAASFTGSIFGLCVGFKLFPIVIFSAYQIMYILPDITAPFKWSYAIICTIVALLCTCFAALSVCLKVLYETPSALMRPKTPEAGKNVLFERIGFLWNRLSFLHKVTVRNIFRYKKRVIMTVVGIAGCTALMLTALGLRYAITEIVDLQYDNIFTYDLIGVFDSNLEQNEIDKISSTLNKSIYVATDMLASQKSVSISTNDISTKREVYMLIPADVREFDDYITFRDRKNKMPIELTNEGLIIVEKIAKLYNVEVGDKIRVYINDNNYSEIPISGITENYTLNYIYMSPCCYEKYFNKKVDINSFLVNMNDASKESELSTELLKNDHILTLSYASEGGGKFRDIISSMNYIVLVIIICAGALAFVVLYNLANINMTERRRELATIKVLGFFDNEVANYINRENIVSSIIGIIIGLLLGIPLEKFVIAHAEVDSVMFVPTIPASCFAYSIILTFAFVLIVNSVISQKLKKIDMVESLKSVE